MSSRINSLSEYWQCKRIYERLSTDEHRDALLAKQGRGEITSTDVMSWARICDERRERLIEYQRDNPFVTFTPWLKGAIYHDTSEDTWRPCYSPTQAEVWEAYFGDVRYIFVSGGTGSGKTHTAMGIATDIAMRGPKHDVMVFAQSYDLHKVNTQLALWELRCGSELAKTTKNWTRDNGFGDDGKDPLVYTRHKTWRPGLSSTIGFYTYKQALTDIVGPSVVAVIYNEIPPSKAWLIEGQNRLRKAPGGGWVILAATFAQMNTVYRWLTEPKNGFKIFHMPKYGNPSVTEEAKKRDRETLSPREYRAYVEGHPMSLGGVCYHAFSPDPADKMVVDRKRVPDPQRMVYAELTDFHTHKPIAWQRWGIDSDGVSWCLAELWWGKEAPGCDGLITSMAKRIWEIRLNRRISKADWAEMIAGTVRCPREEMWRMPIQTAFDQSTKDESHREGETEKEQLERLLATDLDSAQRLPQETRVRMVNESLTGAWNYVLNEARPGTVDDPRPQLKFVEGRCPMTISQMETVEWEIYQTEGTRELVGDRKAHKQRIDEDFTDLVDYHVSMCRVRYVGRDEREQERRDQAVRRHVTSPSGHISPLGSV